MCSNDVDVVPFQAVPPSRAVGRVSGLPSDKLTTEATMLCSISATRAVGSQSQRQGPGGVARHWPRGDYYRASAQVVWECVSGPFKLHKVTTVPCFINSNGPTPNMRR